MLQATKVKKEETLFSIYRFRRQLLYELHQLELRLRDSFYWMFQSGFDDEHYARLETMEDPNRLYRVILSEDIVCAIYNALNVSIEGALDAYTKAFSIYQENAPLQKYNEFLEMDRIKASYDATFLMEELLKTPRVSMAKYKVGLRRTNSKR